MPTYYKYAEREADSYINWAEISKSMVGMLSEQNKIREEKKAAIDEASRSFGETLTNAPQGESKLMNEWALQYSADAQSARLMQDKLLKSGQLKLKDYLVMRQNVTDGTTNAFTLVNEYQDEFKVKWDRMKKDESSDLEQFLMSEVEGFADFSKTQLYINPTDGKVNVAYKDEQIIGGKKVYTMSKKPNKFADINALRNRVKGQFDKYDVDVYMDEYVKSVGKNINSFVEAKNSFGATGTIRETLDIMTRGTFPTDPVKLKSMYEEALSKGFVGSQSDWLKDQENLRSVAMDFAKAETKILQSQLANPYNAQSILTNSVNMAPNGKEYSFTWDPDDAKANKEKILLKNKNSGAPVPSLSPEQEEVALEYLRTQARLRYDKASTLTTTPQLQKQFAPQYVQQGAEKTKEDIYSAGAWNQLYTGKTAAQKQAAADILLGTPQAIRQGLMGIDLKTTPGSVILMYDNSSLNRTIPMEDASGTPIPLRDWSAKGVELHGVTDINKSYRAGGGGEGYGQLDKKTGYGSIVAQRQGKGEGKVRPELEGAVTAFADSNTRSAIKTQDATQTAANLLGLYSDLGFTFEADEEKSMTGTKDNIRITGTDGVKSAWIPVDDMTNLETIKKFIKAHYDKNLSEQALLPPK